MTKSTSPQPGDIVTVQVERVEPAGVLVRLPDGSSGIIRRRELSWDKRIRHPERAVKKDAKVRALVMDHDSQFELWELSARQAEGDPWHNLERKLRRGVAVRGQVVGVFDHGAQVQVIPGVDALLSAEEVPLKTGHSVKDAIWVGDSVVGCITYLDPTRKQMRLSLREYLDKIDGARERLRERAEDHEPIVQELAPDAISKSGCEELIQQQAEEPWHSGGGTRPIRRILMVSDERAFHEPLVKWLRRKDYDVEVAETGAEAYSKVKSGAGTDLIILDADLAAGDGMQVATAILDILPSLPIVLITGMDWLQRDLDVKDMGIVDVILKPPDFDEIEVLMQEIARGKRVRQTPQPRYGGRQAELIRHAALVTSGRRDWLQCVEGVLESALKSTGATSGMVFEMDPVTEEAKTVAQVGSVRLNSGYDWDQARYSAIRDVIRGGEEILEADVNTPKSEARFRNLLSLLDFTSCIGVPVEVPTQSIRYGLFLFHVLPQRFDKSDFALAQLAAQLLVVTVERRSVLDSVQTMQQFATIGQLSAGMLHEIGNQFTGMEQCIKNLELTAKGINPEKMLTLEELGDFRADLEALSQIKDEIRELIHFYLGLIRPADPSFVDVNQMLVELMRRLRREARENHVDIVVEPQPDLPHVLAAGPRLQQAFLNVMLNGIQQMGLHSERGGLLVITTRLADLPDPLPIKVTFSDDGPGIHREMFESVFDQGVSTRKGGAGLGLFISRILLESLGGRIRVEDSAILLGSSFLVELPAMQVQGVRS